LIEEGTPNGAKINLINIQWDVPPSKQASPKIL